MAQRETAGISRAATPRQRGRVRPQAQESRKAPADAERIRILAYEIYESRSSSGMLGDPVSDWLEAERRLNEPREDAGGSGETRTKRPGK